jgi:hypothetical protein
MNGLNNIRCFLLATVVCLFVLLSVHARYVYASPSNYFTDQNLDDLLAPIALYPDPLLAEILPASTYPSEIAAADSWLYNGGAISSIDRWNWAESVKAVAHYPIILKMMAENMDWTATLGEAFLNQPEDVTSSVQRLRWLAYNNGNLQTNNEQTVIIEGDYIRIIPSQPQYVYIPQYDPSAIYVTRWTPGNAPFIAFGLGLAIGDWLSMDFDWGYHRLFYHGWNRPGWVNNARPYIKVRNVYINRSRPYINPTWRHDASHGDPGKYLETRPGGSPRADRQIRVPEVRGSAKLPPRPSGAIFGPRGNAPAYSIRGKKSLGVVPTRPTEPTQDQSKRPAVTAPKISQQPISPVPSLSKRPSPDVPKKQYPITSPRTSQQPMSPAAGFIKRSSPELPKRPTVTAPKTSRQPMLPVQGFSKSSSPALPARESLQTPRTPSTVFGGYRGADEAKAQSIRGQTSRQGKEEVRPSTAPVSRERSPSGKKPTQNKR